MISASNRWATRYRNRVQLHKEILIFLSLFSKECEVTVEMSPVIRPRIFSVHTACDNISLPPPTLLVAICGEFPQFPVSSQKFLVNRTVGASLYTCLTPPFRAHNDKTQWRKNLRYSSSLLWYHNFRFLNFIR